MSTSALTQELHALFRSPGGLQPAGRQDCRRIILELIKLSHQPNEEGNEYDHSRDILLVCAHIIENLGIVFEDAPISYLQSILLALAPLLSNPNYASTSKDAKSLSDSDVDSGAVDAASKTTDLSRPSQMMGHIAFKLLRPKDAFLFRGFAADCVTLLTDSMDALSLLFSQESDPNHMDDTPAALLAFASLTPSNTPQDTTNSIEIPLGNMERCVSLIVCTLQLLRFFLERDSPILVDLIDELWAPVISVLRRYSNFIGDSAVIESLRVLCLLGRYGPCPGIQEDHLVSAVLAASNMLCDSECHPMIKLSSSLLFRTLDAFELREESLNVRAADFIEKSQMIITSLGQIDLAPNPSESMRLAEGCLDLLGVCARASPSNGIKIATVAVSCCFSSSNLAPRVVDVLSAAVAADTSGRIKSTHSGYEPPSSKRARIQTIRSISTNNLSESSNLPQAVADAAPHQSVTWSGLLKLGNALKFDSSIEENTSRAVVLRTIVDVAIKLKDWLSLPELTPAVERLLQYALEQVKSNSHSLAVVSLLTETLHVCEEWLSANHATTSMPPFLAPLVGFLSALWNLPKNQPVSNDPNASERIWSSDSPAVTKLVDFILSVANWLPLGEQNELRKKLMMHCINDARPAVVRAALMHLPFFLQRNNPNLLSDFLITLRDLSVDASKAVALEVVEAVGFAACLFSSHSLDSFIVSASSDAVDSSLPKRCLPYCHMCRQRESLASSTSTSGAAPALPQKFSEAFDAARMQTQPLSNSQVTLLAFLIKDKDPKIARVALRSIGRLMQHASLSIQEIVSHMKALVSIYREGSGNSNDDGKRIAALGSMLALLCRAPEMPVDSQATYSVFMELKPFVDDLRDLNLPSARRLIALNACTTIACYVDDEGFDLFFQSILEPLVDPSVEIRGLSLASIHRVCEQKKMNLKDLVISRKDNIVTHLVQTIKSSPLLEIVTGLMDTNVTNFLSENLEIILPKLVYACSDATIVEIAKRLNETPKSLISSHLKTILPTCFLDGLDHSISTYLSTVLQSTLSAELVQYNVPIVKLLVFNLGSSNARLAAKALDTLEKSSTYLVPNDIKHPRTALEHLLKSSYLEILDDYYRFKLSLARTPSAVKRQAVRALGESIKLLDDQGLRSFYIKIISILKYAMTFSELREDACSAWLILLRRLDHGIFDGPLLSDLVVHFTSYLEEAEKFVLPLFRYLFLEARSHFEKFYQDIPFMPDKPESLKECITSYKYSTKNQLKEPRDQLLRLSRVISHESANVRIAALEKLISLMRSESKVVQDLVSRDPVDDIIKGIVTLALNGSSDPSSTVRNLCATVLGEVGAIDPTRIRQLGPSGPSDKNSYGKTDLEIAKDMLRNHLFKLFKAASSPATQDMASFSIQELLRSLHCAESVSDAEKRTPAQKVEAERFWALFNSEEKLLLNPFRTSKFYTGTDFAEKVRALPLSTPLYSRKLSKYESTKYDYWIADWTTRLILSLNDSKSIFHTVIGCLRHDRDLCHSIVPHLVMKILLGRSDEAINSLAAEFHAVLRDTGDAADVRELNRQATETVFAIFDYLSNYVETVRAEEKSRGVKHGEPSASAPISRFLNGLDQKMLCEAAFRQKNFARALQHFENIAHSAALSKAEIDSITQFLPQNPDTLPLLQKIYVGLDEPDLLTGISTIHTTRSSFDDRLLQYESAGRWIDSLNSVDQSLQSSSLDAETLRKRHLYRLRCLINLYLYDSALALVKAELADKVHYNENHAQLLRSYGVDAARRLGKWQLVDEFLRQGCHPSFDLSIAQILLALKNVDESAFKKHLQLARLDQMSLLSSTMSEFSRSYPIMARLHMLTDIEKSWLLVVDKSKETVNAAIASWEPRMQLVQPIFRIVEPILSLRMAICEIANITGKAVDQSWLRIAKYARADKKFQLAHYALLRVQNQENIKSQVERAQLELESGHPSDALAEVSRVLGSIDLIDDVIACIADYKQDERCQHVFHSPDDPEERQAWGQAILFTLRSIENSGDARVSTLLHALTMTLKDCSDGHLALARFLDRYNSETTKNWNQLQRLIGGVPASRILVKTMHYYVTALQYGTQFVYQVGPRLLTLWLDFTEKTAPEHQVYALDLTEIKRIMTTALQKLPPGMWYTVLPQLISRATHPDATTWDLMQKIIADKLLETYPRHVPWHFMAWSRGNPDRVERYNKLRSYVQSTKSRGSFDYARILDQAERLSDFLLDVADYDVEEGGTVKAPTTKWIINLKYIVDAIQSKPKKGVTKKRQPIRLEQMTFDLVVPVESELFHLPLTDAAPLSKPITIAGFGDEVEVMKSMVKPRRIDLLGSDGQSYAFLAKPKDDLRKDARVTDFNNVVNYLLKQEPEGRRRQLTIRTYGVIVLNSTCGLLSWVRNTQAVRNLTYEQYEATGRNVKHIASQFKARFYESKGPKTDKIWRDMVTKYCKPSQFWRWFIVSFPEPSAWYRARLAFTRTTAVMSMVGHILGLGDRHGENILIDSKTGDCVHVDLNCVFHKGQTFQVPERVPFRLTHNIVDAMGVTGYDGAFRSVAELTMLVLRKNKETLISVLNSLIHDPLVDWSSKSRNSDSSHAEAQGNAALTAVADRLDGIKRDTLTKSELLLPMSVESLVDSLIRDATSDTNLRQMYMGWMAYI